MPTNYLTSVFKVLLELVWEFFYFPLWWYSEGFFKFLKWIKNFLSDKQKALGLIVWVKNIFTPMYGQYDFVGVLISFVVRFFQIIFRSIMMSFWILIAILLALIWLVLPIFITYQIIFQFLK